MLHTLCYFLSFVQLFFRYFLYPSRIAEDIESSASDCFQKRSKTCPHDRSRSICHQSSFHVPANSGKLRWVVLVCQSNHWLLRTMVKCNNCLDLL